MDNGVVENELCPVFTATSADEVRADPAEVEEHRWEPWSEFRESVLAGAGRLLVVPRAGRRAPGRPRVRPGAPAVGAASRCSLSGNRLLPTGVAERGIP